MRRFSLITTMLLVMVLVMVACGGDDPTPTPEPTAAPEAATPAAEEPAEAEEAEESTEAVTETEELTATEELTSAAETTATEEMTATEVATDTEGAAAPAPVAVEAGAITVESERSVSEIVNESDAPIATISPDGATIAWVNQSGRGRNREGYLCTFAFDNAEKQCYVAPDEYEGYPYQLAWSPDSAYIALTENPEQLGYESDVWVFSVADGTFTNRTDDGVTGSYVAEAPGSYTLDYLPMWNEADGMLYFWRSTPLENYGTYTLALYRMDAVDGDPEEVVDLTEYFSTQLLLFDYELFFLDGVSAISPDGTKVAIIVQSVLDPLNTPGNGLWLVDLNDLDAAPQQLATVEQFQAALPVSQGLPAVPMGLSWTADGQGIVALAASNDTYSPMILFYYVNIQDGSMTPVVDFSSVTDVDQLYNETSDAGIPLRYYSPWTGSLSPAGNTLLMFNDLGGVQGILAAPLPPDGAFPPVVFQSESDLTSTAARSSRADAEKVLMSGLMFVINE